MVSDSTAGWLANTWAHEPDLAPSIRTGQGATAVRLMAFAQAYWTGHFAPLSASDEREMARLLRLARVRLDPARVDSLWRDGCAMGVSDAVAVALAQTPVT